MTFLHNRSLFLLRLSLGICFLWFGVLKLFTVSPDIGIISIAFPFIVRIDLFNFLLALLEILIGFAYLSNKVVKFASIVMIISVLVVSIAVFISQGFDPRFPVLSLAGEHVLKNLVLISAGLVLVSEQNQTSSEKITKKE